MSDTVRILLVRHAQSEANIDDSRYSNGDTDISITQQGVQEALSAGAFLTKYYNQQNVKSWPQVFVGAYVRTQQTLNGLYQGGLNHAFNNAAPNPIEDMRLNKRFYGAASYLENKEKFPEGFATVLEGLAYEIYNDDPHYAPPIFGESISSMHLRVQNFKHEVLKSRIESEQKEFLIVTHGAVMQSFMMGFANLPMRTLSEIAKPQNCDVIAIEGTPENWSITQIYDGEEMKALNINPIASAERLTMKTLPPLPNFK